MIIVPKCIVCNSSSTHLKKVKGGTIYRCNACALEFCYPMPSKKSLNEFYNNYFNPRAGKDISRRNGLANANHLKKYGLTKNKRLLDFGCGDNIFATMAKTKNWIGYDPYGKIGSLEAGRQFDFITLWGVLEHLVDPLSVMRKLHPHLIGKGKIVITTVGTETPIPYQYKVPEHVTWWSRKAIEQLLADTGYDMLEFSNYHMYQNPKVYLDCVLNAGRVPSPIKKMITIKRKKYLYVPTNEILIVGQKKG